MTNRELGQFIAAHGKEIYSFCLYLTRERTEADDLYQDVFVTAVEAGDRIELSRNPKCYLLSVAVNHWRNRRRKAAWRLRLVGEQPQEDGAVSPPEELPETQFLADEAKEAVRRSVRKLPEKLKTVVLLYYMEELSVADIAAILHVPAGTVKSRLHKARQMLQKDLSEYL